MDSESEEEGRDEVYAYLGDQVCSLNDISAFQHAVDCTSGDEESSGSPDDEAWRPFSIM